MPAGLTITEVVEPGAYRNDNPDTSKEAAFSVNATKLEQKVLDAIESARDGANAYELEGITSLNNQTLTPRFAPLVRKGLIHDSGLRRPGVSGRKQIVWKAGPKPVGV